MALLTVKWQLIAIPFLLMGCEAQRTISSEPETVANLREIRATPQPEASPTPTTELTLANGLKITPKSIEMSDEYRRYKVDVSYPQIEGSDDRTLKTFNRRIEAMVKEHYKWLLATPTRDDLRHYAKWPGVFNSVYMDYDILLASPTLLSLYFESYSYGIGAAHSVEESFTINYNFEERRSLRLSDLFRRDGEALKLIAEHCVRELSQNEKELFLHDDKLLPRSNNFQKWNMTSKGLRFTFNACEIYSCAAGKQKVDISFAELKPLLLPRYGNIH